MNPKYKKIFRSDFNYSQIGEASAKQFSYILDKRNHLRELLKEKKLHKLVTENFIDQEEKDVYDDLYEKDGYEEDIFDKDYKNNLVIIFKKMLNEKLNSADTYNNSNKDQIKLMSPFHEVMENNNNKKEVENKNNTEKFLQPIEDKISEKIGSIKSFFRRERLGFVYCVIAQFIWTTNSVYLKFLTQYYKSKFKNKTFLFPRGLAIIIFSYFLGNHFDGKIYKLSELSPLIRKCLLTRANVSFFGMCFWLIAVYYLRITTCQIISTLNPIVLIYFGVIFLKEKYHPRYGVGVILGIVGSSIIVLNENKLAGKKVDSESSTSDVLIGISAILANICFSGVIGVVNKIMANEKISLYTQLFYFGIFHSSYSFLWMLFTKDFDYTIPYFFLCSMHACLFFLGNYFNYLGFILIDLSKTSVIQYTKIIFVFLLGTILLGEKIFFSDILGSVIIVSYMIYHVMNPIK